MTTARRFSTIRAVQAGIWLVFLIFAIAALFTRSNSTLQIGIGLALFAVFSAVYLAGFGLSESVLADHRGLYWLWIAAMAVPIVCLIPLIGVAVVYTIAYFAAAFIFVLPLSAGLSLTIFLVLASNLILWLVYFDDPVEILYSFGGTVLAPLIIVVVGLVTRRETRMIELSHRLDVSKEREDVARDVHDLLGHSLTVINLKAEVAARLTASDPDAARAELLEISRLSRVALADVRSTVTRLRRPDFLGEVEAARRALTTAGITSELPDGPTAEQVPGVNAPLFSWALREAVTNVVRHSGASRCTVRLSPEKIQIDDDGAGIGSDFGNGLEGLRERVESSGGTLVVENLLAENERPAAAAPGTRVLVSMSGDTAPLEGATP